jgi:macrolide-specific efflux system membrane fusion protein
MQGMRNGQAGAGGGFNGPRPGGAGGAGGFNPQNMTPEMIEQMRARRQNGGGFPGGTNGQRMGGFGGQRGGAGSMMGSNGGGAAAGPRPVQPRNGTVMVKKADGTLEARRIVYGVTNRVHAQVLEGLKEGEEVVVGKRETEAASASAPRPNNNNNNNNFQNNRGGGNFNGGGGNFRPF